MPDLPSYTGTYIRFQFKHKHKNIHANNFGLIQALLFKNKYTADLKRKWV